MEPEDLQEVERIQGNDRVRRGCVKAGLAGAIVGGGALGAAVAAAIGLSVAPHELPRFAGTGVVVGLVYTAVFIWKSPRARTVVGLDQDVGDVELVHVHAFGVARVPNAFFFDVGEGNVLFLRGPYLHAAVRSALFPNRYFTLVRLPISKRVIRILCHGEPITSPSAPPGPEIDFEALPDGAILPARLETVRQDVAALIASGWKPA
jgi:hypothetical protein